VLGCSTKWWGSSNSFIVGLEGPTNFSSIWRFPESHSYYFGCTCLIGYLTIPFCPQLTMLNSQLSPCPPAPSCWNPPHSSTSTAIPRLNSSHNNISRVLCGTAVFLIDSRLPSLITSTNPAHHRTSCTTSLA
jgi:hypothetical protein